MNARLSAARAAAGLAAVLASVPLLGGCYLIKQGAAIVSYNARARSIQGMLADPDLDPGLRRTLVTAEAAKEFAAALGLRRDRSYTRYVSMDRDYLADVVSACARDFFTPYLWRYPFAGAFPYKGFFDRRDALREARRLEARDLDVLVRKVDAFSTLGFCPDPVFSYMADYSPFQLASLIIHEQTHATVFIKNQVQFNEEMATFVGWQGALELIRSRYGEGSAEMLQATRYLEDWRRYSELMVGLYGELDRLYRANRQEAADRGATLAERERLLEAFRRRYRDRYAGTFHGQGFRDIDRVSLNNAYLISFARYNAHLGLFYRLYARTGNDLPRTVALLKGLARGRGRPEERLRALVESL